jgi:hypothetical protein
VRQLGARLLLHGGNDFARSLADVLAQSIEEVAKLHGDTCDLSYPGSL